MGYGEKIRELRLKNNMTQAELANKLKVSESSVVKYEIEERIPRDSVKVSIANLFGVSVGHIFFGEECHNE